MNADRVIFPGTASPATHFPVIIPDAACAAPTVIPFPIWNPNVCAPQAPAGWWWVEFP